MALLIWDLEKAFRAKLNAEAEIPALPGAHILVGGCADTPAALPMRQRFLLRNDLGLPRTLIVGGGGCGKTTLCQEVISPTFEAYFARVARATPSNKSAAFSRQRLFNPCTA